MAAPGTLCGARTRRISASSVRLMLSRRDLSVRICTPRTQVAITVNSEAPISRGAQPPETIFRALAARKVTSSSMKGVMNSTACHRRHFHR